MLLTTRHESAKATTRGESPPKMPSPGLEWLWQQLRDVRRPHILDCGAIRQSTVDVFIRRGAKLYVADLVTPARNGNPKFWDRSKKVPVFLTEDFLAQIPKVSVGSLSAVFCWHLLDLIPPEAIAPTIERLFSFLQPGGVLFSLLRQPYLAEGSDASCGLDGLKALEFGESGKKTFAYPVVTNREMERHFPSGSVKIFLTRLGRREVVALK
jgi:hypothetical protein